MSLKKLGEKIEYYFKKLNKFLGAVGWTIIVSCFVILCVISYYNHRLYQAYGYEGGYGRMMESRFNRGFGNDDSFGDMRMIRNRVDRELRDADIEMRQEEARIQKISRQFQNIKNGSEYSQYVSVNGDQFQYNISYNSGIVDGFVRVDDQNKSQMILSGLQNLNLKVENNNGKIFFNGKIDEVNKVLAILTQ